MKINSIHTLQKVYTYVTESITYVTESLPPPPPH